MGNQLEQLKAMTDVVADTGDIEAIAKFKPLDATTNPSLVLKATELDAYQPLLEQAQNSAKQGDLGLACDQLAVQIGCEILQHIPGRVSTEVDARLSFNCEATVNKARQLINMYQQAGVDSSRILIKIAATWEGIKAAEILEQEGINCNLTLIFGFAQAAACAAANVTLISPFVGRILDWYKHSTGRSSYAATEDPGVLSVQAIYNFYKQHNYSTIVMGASFRNIDEIRQLAGCDRLTISPQLLQELEDNQQTLPQILSTDSLGKAIEAPANDEKTFRWLMNEDAMATEKLAEGIRNFAADQIKLEKLVSQC